MKMNENESVDEICFSDGQLSCIGQEWTYIPSNLAAKYGARVRRLDLTFNAIRSLEGIENFTGLEELILDNNDITDDTDFPKLSMLHTLMLNKNKLRDLDQLLDRLVKSCVNLRYLSLLGNEACPNQLSSLDKDEEDYQRYRYYVLYRMPNLKFLDSTPVKEEERQESQQRGQFLKVIRPTEDVITDSKEESVFSRYTPLPAERSKADHKATFGRCKYVYYGRHSEGNRFIRNNDL